MHNGTAINTHRGAIVPETGLVRETLVRLLLPSSLPGAMLILATKAEAQRLAEQKSRFGGSTLDEAISCARFQLITEVFEDLERGSSKVVVVKTPLPHQIIIDVRHPDELAPKPLSKNGGSNAALSSHVRQSIYSNRSEPLLQPLGYAAHTDEPLNQNWRFAAALVYTRRALRSVRSPSPDC